MPPNGWDVEEWRNLVDEINERAGDSDGSEATIEVNGKDVDFVLDALKEKVARYNTTMLSNREAQVATLKDEGFHHDAIALILGIEKPTVDEYSRRVLEKVDKARELIEVIFN